MLIPALVLLALFVFVPILLSFQFSFTNERLMPQPLPARWLGLRNYERVLTDPEFWTAVRNTVYFAAVVIPVQLSLSLAPTGRRLLLRPASALGSGGADRALADPAHASFRIGVVPPAPGSRLGLRREPACRAPLR